MEQGTSPEEQESEDRPDRCQRTQHPRWEFQSGPGGQHQVWTEDWPDKRIGLSEGAAVLADQQVWILSEKEDDGNVAFRSLDSVGDRVQDLCRFMSEEEHLLVVNGDGQALKVSWREDRVVQVLDELREQPGSPSRGKVFTQFKSCASGRHHLVLIDLQGQAWSFGQGPQIGRVQKDQDDDLNVILTRIDFLQGMRIKEVSAGADFNLALVEHGPVAEEETHPSNLAACPLGLPILQHSSQEDLLDGGEVTLRKKTRKPSKLPLREAVAADPESTLPNSTQEADPSGNGAASASKEGEGLPSSNGDEKSESPQVERLTQSGLYINPSDALKYLSNQLSWVGLAGDPVKSSQVTSPAASTPSVENQPLIPEEEKAASPSPSAAVKSNLSRATSAVADGVKYVGQTVSRFSYSFSVDEGDEDEKLNLRDSQGDPSIPLGSLSSSSTDSERGPMSAAAIGAKESSARRYQIQTFHRRSQSASMLDKLSRSLSLSSPENSGKGSKGPSAAAAAKKNLLPVKQEVWFWGRGNRGQAGQCDMLDRLQPNAIGALSELSVQKVACGLNHCLALTLSGCVYGWGDNSMGQSSTRGGLKVCSSPVRVDLPVGETACDISAGDRVSYILTDTGATYSMGSESKSKRGALIKVELWSSSKGGDGIPKKIVSTQTGVAAFKREYDLPLANLKSVEKLYLYKLTTIKVRVTDTIFNKPKDKWMDDEYFQVRKSLGKAIAKLTQLVTESVQASWDFTIFEHCSQHPLIKQTVRYEKAICDFNRALCDAIIQDYLLLDSADFNRLSTVIREILSEVCHADHLDTGQDLVQPLLNHLLAQPEQYLTCFNSMILAGRKQKKFEVLAVCDQLEKSAQAFKSIQRRIEKEQRIMEETKKFWEIATPKLMSLKTSSRRVLLDSRSSPIGVSNSGSFSKNWIILMNDLLVHSGYSSFSSHPLQTIWIESHQSSGDTKNEITLVMPEDSLVLAAPSAEAKNVWFQALQKEIISALQNERDSPSRVNTYTPPITRKTKYSFTKLPDLKGASYSGSWLHGKMHGPGVLTWADGRVYRGQLRQNQKHGEGRLEVSGPQGTTVFDGMWKNDRFEGRGKIFHHNGDYYEGMLKEGRPHGQGIFKQGKFMGSGASVYNGEWSGGLRHGYGVSDDIISGEKYMGMWMNDMKNGPGCVVTLDGVYYEGSFNHNKMTGKGLMLFEDETSYEGHFADAGVFSGHGALTYDNGDRLEGSFYGNYTDGMKFNGTVFKTMKQPNQNVALVSQDTPLNKEKIGTFSVPASQKWASIFSHFHEILCLPESWQPHEVTKASMVWEQMAILINQAKNSSKEHHSIGGGGSSSGVDLLDGLEMIPDYYCVDLTKAYFDEVNDYLGKAFSSSLHPLSDLLSSLTDCYNATYGGVRVHPRLLKHAVQELESVVNRLYFIIRVMFPALPQLGLQSWISTSAEADSDSSSSAEESGRMVSSTSVIYPFILPRVHSSVFMLYALYYKKDDDEYWARILKWNKHPDIALLSFLDVDQKFWALESSQLVLDDTGRKSISSIRDRHFLVAIETLQHIKTKFTPYEKLTVILDTFREVNRVGQEMCGSKHCWSMDDLFPVFQYIVVRARILQLGAEIHLLEDLMEPYLFHGEYGIMFTTLQASYYQILRESLSI